MNSTALIMLHGSGMTGQGLRTFLEVVPVFRNESGSNHNSTFRDACEESFIDIITPTALKRPSKLALGMNMNIWFDRSSSWNTLGIKVTSFRCRNFYNIE